MPISPTKFLFDDDGIRLRFKFHKTREGRDKITIEPESGNQFRFNNSSPEQIRKVLRAVGKVVSYSKKKLNKMNSVLDEDRPEEVEQTPPVLSDILLREEDGDDIRDPFELNESERSGW